jgi:predicted nucleic acid-binding protein
MDHLADTNVLIRSVEWKHSLHPEAAAAMKALLLLGQRVCITPQNVAEFWNVCTRPADGNGLGLSLLELDREVSRLESILLLLPDVPAIYSERRRLVVSHSISGAQVHDARLVAAMNVYGISRILTFNIQDFARYPGIAAVHPSDLAGGARQ